MFDKEAYLKELRLQLAYVDNVRDYEDIMETIAYLEEGEPAEEWEWKSITLNTDTAQPNG